MFLHFFSTCPSPWWVHHFQPYFNTTWDIYTVRRFRRPIWVHNKDFYSQSMFRQTRGSKQTCHKHTDYWRWLTTNVFSHCRQIGKPRFNFHIRWQDSESQFHWQCELLEQQLWLLRIFGFWNQFATILISNIFESLRKNQAFPICTTSTDK